MQRRDFIKVIAGSATSWPFAARAQQTSKPPVVGFLHASSTAGIAEQLSGFNKGLAESGYVEGRNVNVEYRFAEGHYDRLPAMAAELAERRVTVMIAGGGNQAVQAAKAATSDIPIIFNTGGDPVNTGLVESLNHPGGNITGVSMVFSALSAKRLSILHQLAPNTSLVGVLINPNYPDAKQQLRDLQDASEMLKQPIYIVRAGSSEAVDAAFKEIAGQHAGALLVGNDPYLESLQVQIVALAARYALPGIYDERGFVDAGGLASYGPSLAEAYRQVGLYAVRILKGEKPADLPVLQPTKFDLVINLKTAKTLGLKVPDTLLATADEVIE
jgi:putative tryptophan/tyrosine transport system substrate-binding protein